MWQPNNHECFHYPPNNDINYVTGAESHTRLHVILMTIVGDRALQRPMHHRGSLTPRWQLSSASGGAPAWRRGRPTGHCPPPLTSAPLLGGGTLSRASCSPQPPTTLFPLVPHCEQSPHQILFHSALLGIPSVTCQDLSSYTYLYYWQMISQRRKVRLKRAEYLPDLSQAAGVRQCWVRTAVSPHWRNNRRGALSRVYAFSATGVFTH